MISVTGKLNKPAQQFQAGESTGFGVRIGVQYYDRVSKTKEWTNYKAVLFAKAPGQIQFLSDNLIQGAIVEISGDNQKIDVYEGEQGTMYSIEILGAKIGYVSSGQQRPPQQAPQNSQPLHPPQAPSQQAPQQQPPQQHGQYQGNQPPANTGRQAPQNNDGFDDAIPF